MSDFRSNPASVIFLLRNETAEEQRTYGLDTVKIVFLSQVHIFQTTRKARQSCGRKHTSLGGTEWTLTVVMSHNINRLDHVTPQLNNVQWLPVIY